MDYLDRPLVVELAQLALDVYNNPDDNKLRETEFNPLWQKVDQWPHPDDFTRTSKAISRHPGHGDSAQIIKKNYDVHTGFYAAFYRNFATEVGVIAIRGTDLSVFLDLVADYDYVMNKILDQYEEACQFWHIIKDYYLITESKKLYVCGHSLGGIIAKMIAPFTGSDTIAFNSPGVREYLTRRHLPTHHFMDRETPYRNAFEHQKIVTYCAKGCPIGNLRHDNDIGPYKFVDVKGGEQIPEEHDRLNDEKFIKYSIKNRNNYVFLTKYHGMSDMYQSLKESQYKNDHI